MGISSNRLKCVRNINLNPINVATLMMMDRYELKKAEAVKFSEIGDTKQVKPLVIRMKKQPKNEYQVR